MAAAGNILLFSFVIRNYLCCFTIQCFIRLLLAFSFIFLCFFVLIFLHQAQAAEYEQSLAARVAELKANALAREAAVREQEKLDFRHAERLQVRVAGLACICASFFSLYP